jgi:hypothetical protein
MAELTYTPESPSAGDSLTFTVTGEVTDTAKIVLTSDGDEVQASPEFSQGAVPEGTGGDAWTLQIFGGTSGDFTLTVSGAQPEYHFSDDYSYETEPIYYFADEPNYTYPDTASVIAALEAAVPGLSVTATKTGSVMNIVFGGDYTGKNVVLDVDATGIEGSETTAVTDVAGVGGPFVWGPVMLAANVYTADVIYQSGDDEGESALDDEVTITVT